MCCDVLFVRMLCRCSNVNCFRCCLDASICYVLLCVGVLYDVMCCCVELCCDDALCICVMLCVCSVV